MRLFLLLAGMAVLLASPAAAESALNKEGYWTVGRGGAEAEGCLASITVGDTAMFFVQAVAGEATYAVGTKKPMRKGKQGVLIVGDLRFGFAPVYGDKSDLMFIEDASVGPLAAMREARWVSVMIDGREVVAVDLKDTGVAGAMDAVVACSRGESGWWGPGVGAPATVAKTDEADDGDGLVYEEPGGVWGISTHAGYCIAQAEGPDARFLQLLSTGDRTGLGIGSNGAPLPRGAKARAETDSYKFEFRPEYTDGARYLTSADALSAPDLFALQRAKRLRVTAGGRELLDVAFEGDSFFEIVDAVAACARGEKGWWGEGAKPAS